jgi:acetyl esterase/lipase
MSVFDRIDPEQREALDQFLRMMPGGFSGIPDLSDRRAALAAAIADINATMPPREGVVSEDRLVPGPPGAPDVRLRVYRPTIVSGPLPAIYLIHGGGMSVGGIELDDDTAAMVCEAVNAIVVSVEYRLAPEHPYPAPVDDCYAGLVWMAENAHELGIDPTRLALFGGSAGGGLVIAMALMARDRSGPPVRFMMPFYPMIDDRNETPSSLEIVDDGLWNRAANIEAWGWYLAGQAADAYAAPARAADVSGLPPTFIDVGEVDLFRDEDVAFATRLLQAGVQVELHVYPGAFHAAEALAPAAELSKRIWSVRLAALRRALA